MLLLRQRASISRRVLPMLIFPQLPFNQKSLSMSTTKSSKRYEKMSKFCKNTKILQQIMQKANFGNSDG
jgi:hypothetical protein